jgi:hypothetical protein
MHYYYFLLSLIVFRTYFGSKELSWGSFFGLFADFIEDFAAEYKDLVASNLASSVDGYEDEFSSALQFAPMPTQSLSRIASMPEL